MWISISEHMRHTFHHECAVELVEHVRKPQLETESRKTTLIGWSYGGLRAIEECFKRPDAYEKLILINSATHFSRFTRKYWLLANQNLVTFQEEFLRWVFYPSHQGKSNAWRDHFIVADDENHEQLLSHLRKLWLTDLSEVYSHLTLPILRIHSTHDAVVAPLISNHPMPNETILTWQAGHALPFTHTSELIKVMSAF